MNTNPEVKKQIANLRSALHANETTLCEIFEYVGELAGTQPMLSRALSLHMRDIIMEQATAGEPDIDLADLLCDGIVRSTVDNEHNHLYPTESVLENEEAAVDFIGGMAEHIHTLARDPQLMALASAQCHAVN